MADKWQEMKGNLEEVAWLLALPHLERGHEAVPVRAVDQSPANRKL